MGKNRALIGCLGLCALLFFKLILAGTLPELPELGSSSSSVFDSEKEKILADGFMIAVSQEVPVLEDPIILEYIQNLGLTLTKNLQGETHPFHFFVIDNASINAFAGPGRQVGIHSGLILATENESELAAVMAHEIAHVTQQHIARQFEQSRAMTIPTIAGLIAAIALANKNSTASTAALASTAAAGAQFTVNQIRDSEQEADRVGMRILANSGFDPRAIPLFFKRLQAATRFNRQDIPDIISTHPVTEARIADSESRATRYPKHTDDNKGGAYPFIRTLVQVQSSQDKRKTLSDFKTRKRSSKAVSMNDYGEALCLINLGETDFARKIAERLHYQDPHNLYYTLLLAWCLQETHQPQKSKDLLQAAIKKHPNSYALKLALAESLLLAHQPKDALSLLEPLTTLYPNNPTPFRLAAQSFGTMGQLTAAFESRAQFFFLLGDLKKANEQLEFALKQPHDELFHKRLLERVEYLKKLESEISAA